MTISVFINVPAGKAARVVRSDGAETTHQAGTNIHVSPVYDGLSIEIHEIAAEEPQMTTADGGGNNEPPKPPVKPKP